MAANVSRIDRVPESLDPMSPEREISTMRHRNAGFKLGRNTSHRRALLRNLVTSVIERDRVETTVVKAKAVRPLVEKMITLGKKGDLHARRQALCLPHDRRRR